MENLQGLTVLELRRECSSRNIGSGVWRAGASKAELITALETGKAPEAGANGNGNADLAAIIAQSIAAYMPKQSVDTDSILDILNEELDKIRKELRPVVTIEVKTDSSTIKIDGQHAQFPALLRAVSSRLPVWLTGPAGSGKTTAAESCATALNLPFYPISVGPETGVVDLFGYQDASGKYVATAFRKAFENGGVLLIDEVDAANGAVLTAINAALANGYASFPDGTIKRHSDCIIIAAANTYGTGPDAQYIGRNRLDAATLDRFVYIPWNYDETLERNAALAHNPNADKWIDYVQAIRARALEIGARVIITPRASIHGAKLLGAGFSQAEVAEMVLYKGMDSATRSKLEGN